ncbi:MULTISPECIES: hypothetical protein [Streptomyces]|uniref:hypothetical protein n=1 Tax=Streptomyces TaxID=1883 RepID=UPI0029B416FC|nr:hypothetical protein [Streptomyces sp. WI03-4A]MDX2591539.1 hypothetical protein [Streptomyces sp. WI03-4A]
MIKDADERASMVISGRKPGVPRDRGWSSDSLTGSRCDYPSWRELGRTDLTPSLLAGRLEAYMAALFERYA